MPSIDKTHSAGNLLTQLFRIYWITRPESNPKNHLYCCPGAKERHESGNNHVIYEDIFLKTSHPLANKVRSGRGRDQRLETILGLASLKCPVNLQSLLPMSINRASLLPFKHQRRPVMVSKSTGWTGKTGNQIEVSSTKSELGPWRVRR